MTHFFITLVAKHSDLTQNDANIVGDHKDVIWLHGNTALDIKLQNKPNNAAVAYIKNQLRSREIDVFVSSEQNRQKKLFIADMDSTIVTSETLDDLAAYAGLKDKIAAITQRAMNGELDFHAAIKERVALLKGLSDENLENTLDEIQLSPGASTCVRTMKSKDVRCVLASGGFTFFTSAIAKQIGFDNHHGNILNTENGVLTGTVGEPIQDKDSKLHHLKTYADKLCIHLEDSLTVGDGANDLPMLNAAGIGMGYYAKPSVAEQLDNNIEFTDLTSLLYVQGYKHKEFVISE